MKMVNDNEKLPLLILEIYTYLKQRNLNDWLRKENFLMFVVQSENSRIHWYKAQADFQVSYFLFVIQWLFFNSILEVIISVNQ